jgi:hypothetical protein
MTVRLVSGGTGKKFTLPEVNERINELLKHSIKSEGVINRQSQSLALCAFPVPLLFLSCGSND